MFEGHAGLTMTGDHLDISYHDRDSWPALTPLGSLRAKIFSIGDPEVGPMVQLGLVTTLAEEPLDWRHSIDPLHHHGTDQFRTVLKGAWKLAGRTMNSGDFSWQQSGMIYQEHPGAEVAWTMLVLGDRRGNQATIARKADEATILEYGEIYGAPKDGVEYPHPAGTGGIAAITTTAGACRNGFVMGHAEALADGEAVSGVFGDAAAGPIAHVLKAAAGETVVPAGVWGTDLLVAVVSGSAAVGDETYLAGEIRVQREATPIGAIVAGPQGAEVALIVADRRGHASFEGEAPDWAASAGTLASSLKPIIGGLLPSRSAAGVPA